MSSANSPRSAGNIMRNFGFLTVGKTVGDCFTFLMFVIISRAYGQEGIGQYSFAIAFTGFFAIFADFGLGLYRKELESKGYHFRSSSDTEVVLAAYAHWGEACLDRFNGMWAFAIWDDERQRLFCARDRLGIKPFYYADVGNVFYFDSEAQ